MRWTSTSTWVPGLTMALLAIATPVAANRIIDIQDGSVVILRSGQKLDATIGTTIQPGDVVMPQHGAIVQVRCQDGRSPQPRRQVFGLDDVCAAAPCIFCGNK